MRDNLLKKNTKYYIVFNLLVIIYSSFYPFILLGQNHIDSSGLRQGKWIVNDTYDDFINEDNTTYIIDFKNNLFNGSFLVFDKKKVLRRLSYYRNDTIIGESYLYSKKGKLVSIYSFDNNNNIKAQKDYHKGNLKVIRNYKDNILDGAYILFSNGGKLFSEHYYKNGEILFERTYWNNGRTRTETIYKTSENDYYSYCMYWKNGNNKLQIIIDLNNVVNRTTYKKNNLLNNIEIYKK